VFSTFVDTKTGILWVWPWKEDPIQFVKDEWRYPEGIMKQVIPDDTNLTVTTVSTYSRDLPYGWDTLVENLIDPAHVPFAHHGLQGTRKDAIPINMTRATDKGEAGFSFDWADRTMGMMRKGTAEFRAPYLISYKATFEPKPGEEPGQERKPWALSVLCVPTKPGWSKIMLFTTSEVDKRPANAAEKKKKKKKKFSFIGLIFKKLPKWVMHLLNSKFLDSDLAFLHYQEKLRRPRLTTNADDGAAQAAKGDGRYFMPAECDRCIAALHAYIQKYAPSYVDHHAIKLPPAMYDRKQLFDRNAQHTSTCKICQGALKGIQKWKRNCQLVLAASILLGFRRWAPRLLAVACLGLLKVLGNIEGAFYEGEFKHYENH